ncbi:MAG TPA: DUF1565 domain-containing protein [Candidatus Cybelea sp.]|jgi:hypothetical protein|nr:DUF1565 domain-containing protein [Candidatus Cybelea sp.]
MQSGWFARLFFAVVGVLAVAALMSGTACTRWGQPGPVTPTIAPLPPIFVDPVKGSDSSGNGSQSKPYKTLTKAMSVFLAAKQVTSAFVINLEPGSYTAANGEIFPIVVPKNVTIKGFAYGHGPQAGTFINGAGEDTIFEKLVHASPHTAYTTLEVLPPAMVGFSNIYVGAAKFSPPGSNSFYASLDAIGSTNASDSTFGVAILPRVNNLDGVLVAGGAFSCTSCLIRGNDFGIGALTVPLPTASPYATGPSIVLAHGDADSTIVARVFDIITDGSVSLNVSGEKFAKAQYAFSDSFSPVVPVPVRGAVDFGGGVTVSPGENAFIGALRTEINIVRRNESVYALDDVWNPREQGANRNGSYSHRIIFDSMSAPGKNVTIAHDATGSTVTVGPAPVPTPSSSASPSAPPTSTPTPK